MKPEHLIRRLRDENDTLREEVRQLRDALSASHIPVPSAWSLTPQESAIYRALTGRRLMSRDALLLAIQTPGATESPSPDVIDVHICYLRRKLVIFGGEIETVKMLGYRLKKAPEHPAEIVPAPLVDAEGQALVERLANRRQNKHPRLFLACVRYLLAADGQPMPSRKLADMIYSGWGRPRRPEITIGNAIRNHKHLLPECGWEIVAFDGVGGGFILRKLKAERAAA